MITIETRDNYDTSHGSPFDRGSADSYYQRPRNPHRGGVGGDSGPVSYTHLTLPTIYSV